MNTYHYVNRRQASQQAGWSQQGRHKRVPDDGAGRRADKGQALGAHGLKALWVIHLSAALCGGVASRAARGPPLRRGQGARPPRRPHGVQKGLDPVGGSLGEIAEQCGGVSAQSAQAAAARRRLHRLGVST